MYQKDKYMYNRKMFLLGYIICIKLLFYINYIYISAFYKL